MLRTTVIFETGPGTPYYSTFYYDGSGGLGMAPAAVAATSALMDALEPLTVDNLVWRVQPEVDEVDAATGLVTGTSLETSTLHQGTVSGDPLPWACQALFRWRTGVYTNGREIRGRTYWPGLNDGLAVDGVLTGSAVNAYNAVLAAHLISTGTVGAGGAVVWSPTQGVTAEIIAGQTWGQVAVMRSRRPT